MRTVLDFLESRPLKEEIDFLRIEKRYGIMIPPVFKIFLKTFKWNTTLLSKEFFYYPELAGGEITFPFENIDKNIESTINSSDEEVLKRKLILLGNNRFGFYVGTEEGEKDKIFTRTTSLEGSFIVIADNVFDFF